MYALEDRIEELLGPSRSRGVNRDYQCVVHDERHPSMSVNMETGLWFCHSCGAKGNYERLRKFAGAGPDEEYRWIAARNSARADVPESPDFRHLFREWQEDLHGGNGSQVRGRLSEDFCRSRGIRSGSLDAFRVVERESRLAFPYIDVDERITGVKYRYADGTKSAEPGSEFGLFGVVLASGRPEVIICEGESDTIRVHTEVGDRAGVCGTSGAAVSESQWTRFGLLLLFARRIFLGYDADAAGDKAYETALRVLGDDRCVRLRPVRGKDLTDHLQAGGTLRECIEGSTSGGR